MTARDSARNALNRLAYGATAGEIDAVAREGVLKWVDRQLGFNDPDDPALADLERGFDVLHVSMADMQDLQRKNQLRAARAQTQGDSSARQQMIDDLRTEQQQDRRSLQNLLGQLEAVTVLRAVDSDRQLDEILVDFWTNHFNVFMNKGQDRAFFADYLEHTIRDHALGKFEDLLIATAKSPAMLFYLDNAESVADGSDVRTAAMQRARGRNAGLRPAAGRFPNPRRGVFPGNGAMPGHSSARNSPRPRAVSTRTTPAN